MKKKSTFYYFDEKSFASTWEQSNIFRFLKMFYLSSSVIRFSKKQANTKLPLPRWLRTYRDILQSTILWNPWPIYTFCFANTGLHTILPKKYFVHPNHWGSGIPFTSKAKRIYSKIKHLGMFIVPTTFLKEWVTLR